MPMTRSQIDSSTPPPGEVTQVVEHFFRHEAGKIVSTLTRIFGVEQLNRAEDVVQETLVRALQTWPYYGDRLIEWRRTPASLLLNGERRRPWTPRDIHGLEEQASISLETTHDRARHVPPLQSTAGDEAQRVSMLQAAIAACHCAAQGLRITRTGGASCRSTIA